MNTQNKSVTHAIQKSYKRKIHKRIIYSFIAFIGLMNTAISQAMPPCSPFPMCLTTPQQAAINTLNNLPSRISNNRFVQGGFTSGLRSQISPLLDARFPLFPFQNYNSGFGGVNSSFPIFQGAFAGRSAFAPINFQAIDQRYGGLFRVGLGVMGVQ